MSNNDYSNFETLFNEKLRERGLSLKKLSEITNIATSHLENLSAGRFEDLPPAPYFRGYLARLAPILGFDADLWWERLEGGNLVRSSGEKDELPKNRFANTSQRRLIAILLLTLLVVVYLGLRSPEIFGEPRIAVLYPKEGLIQTASEEIVVRGELANADALTVNRESVPIQERGSWEKRVLLQPGLNTIEISSKKFLGRRTTLLRQVLYEPPLLQTTSTR